MDARAPIILAVDDNPDTLALLRVLLRREGFAVIPLRVVLRRSNLCSAILYPT